jgi:flagellar protein FliJ
MHDSATRDYSSLLRRKQFEISKKERTAALLGTMVRDFEKMVAVLDRQIAAEEEHTRIKDSRHPAYSTFAQAAAQRRHNLLTSVAQMKSTFDVASRELHELTVVLRELELKRNNQQPPAPASSTRKAISVSR